MAKAPDDADFPVDSTVPKNAKTALEMAADAVMRV